MVGRWDNDSNPERGLANTVICPVCLVKVTGDPSTDSADRPTDLLESKDQPRGLRPYSTSNPIKSHAIALYPYYSLTDPSTTLLIQSQSDLPIRLTNALDLSYTHATYPWIHPMTEAYLAPHSLIFTQNGTHFVAGEKEQLAVFDITRTGEGPYARHATRSSKKMRKATGEAGVGLKGLVASLAINNETILAAGTTGRQIGLWATSGV